MFRKLTTKFNGKGKEVNGNTGINSQTDGPSRQELGRKRSSFMPQKKKEEQNVDHSASRADVETSFNKFAQLIHASRRPLPTQSGDGAYLDRTEPTGLVQDLKSIGFRDVETLMELMKSKTSGKLQDDKTYLMERIIQVCARVSKLVLLLTRRQLVSGMPPSSKTRVDLTNAFIDQLWNSLQHPPLSYLGEKYAYRSGDGSYNVSL